MADRLIIGAGLYGLYAALYCGKKGLKVQVLELDGEPFSRATYVNQARVHMGYHYPRSLSTAMKSAGYFKRFVEDYSFCIHRDFRQVYATSGNFSWTDAREFMKFCQDARIPCEPLPAAGYFKEGMCDGAFLTREYTYDARILRDYFLEELRKCGNVELLCGREIRRIVKSSCRYEIYALHQGKEERYEAPFVLNASYASVNQVLEKIETAWEEEASPEGRKGLSEPVKPEPFGIKYELCEIILCRVNDRLENLGLTVMDGPFFSIMPFGRTGYHSLTSVTFTPHKTSRGRNPEFPCMEGGRCPKSPGTEGSRRIDPGRETGSEWLMNCNTCVNRPESAWEYMSALARKYMRDEYKFTYEKSLFSMKPILKAAEIDDSRPTVIKYAGRKPTFVSVLSGKINTVYDLDEFLDED